MKTWLGTLARLALIVTDIVICYGLFHHAVISVSAQAPVQTAAQGIIDWVSLAAMLAVFTALYALLAKMIIAPMITAKLVEWMEAADVKYVHADVYMADAKSVTRHIIDYDRRQESIDQSLRDIWSKVNK